MGTQPITIQVDDEVARIFNTATPEERRKLEALVSLRLLSALEQQTSLAEVMRLLSQRAHERGLTPSILQELLDEPAQ